MSIYEIKAFLKNTAAATDGDKVTFTKAWIENFIRGIDSHLEEVMSDKNDLYNRIESLKTDKSCLEEQLKVLEGEKKELLYSREKLKAEMSELNRENLNLKAQLNEKTNEDIKTSPTMPVSDILHLLYNLTVCRNDNELGVISVGRLKNIRSSIERYYDGMEDRVRELEKASGDSTVQSSNDLKSGFVEYVKGVIKEEEDSVLDRIQTRLKEDIHKVIVSESVHRICSDK